MVFIIALIHAFFPIIGALLSGQKGIYVGTAIGAITACITGASAFTIADLIGVGTGFCIVNYWAEEKKWSIFKNGLNWTRIGNIISKIWNFFVCLCLIIPIPGFICYSICDYFKTSSIRNNQIEQQKLAEARLVQSQKEAEALFVQSFYRGCMLNNAESCFQYANYLESDNFNSDSARLYEKACLLGNSKGCAKIASFYETGKPGYEYSLSMALHYYELANKYSDSHSYEIQIFRIKNKM